ncbi:MAG: glycosyl transferase family 2 [Opitutae bacterium]|nr:glycosyl transferase family 2 [Opitutae bacterium]
MSKASPRISIVLPFRDAATFLADAVESILKQSDVDLELLAIDDGSIDAGPVIVRDFGQRDTRVRCLSTGGDGIVAALNLGLAKAKAPYLARMDADDFSHPNRLERQIEFLDAHPEIGLVASRIEHWTPDEESRPGYAAYVEWTNGLLLPEDLARSRFVESPFAHPSVVFRKELVEKFGGYREGPFPEDYELWLRWMESGVRMQKLPQVLLRWRDHDQRLSRRDQRYSVDAFYEMKLVYLKRWLAGNNPFHPQVKIWGAGRTTRARVAFLEREGVQVAGYYDVDPRKIGEPRKGLTVRPIEEIPPPGEEFIVAMVGARGGREKIAAYLANRGHREGVDFILAA